MMKYRFPILLAICLTYLGLAPSHNRQPKLALTRLGPSIHLIDMEAVAQTSLPSTLTESVYDRYMKQGYEATKQKDYPKALESFQKALAQRPNDQYAQQAIDNVTTYITRESQQARGQNFNLPWMWLGLGTLVIAPGGLLGALFVNLQAGRRQTTTAPRDFLSQTETEPEIESPEQVDLPEQPAATAPSEPKKAEAARMETKDEAEKGEMVPIQQTTRLPTPDVVEELIKGLQTSNPKQRRKAVWELAQQGDSRAIKPLVDLMIDSDSHERSLILEALSRISTHTLKPLNHALALSLQDESAQVRQNGIRDVTKIYDLMSQVGKLLSHATADPDPEVQQTADWALKQLTQITPIPGSSPMNSSSSRKEGRDDT